MANLLMHCGGKQVSRDAIENAPTPEKTKLRLLTQPFGSANVYGTPTTRANERAIRANTDA